MTCCWMFDHSASELLTQKFWAHLRHPNAEIGFLTNQGISIFKTIAEAWNDWNDFQAWKLWFEDAKMVEGFHHPLVIERSYWKWPFIVKALKALISKSILHGYKLILTSLFGINGNIYVHQQRVYFFCRVSKIGNDLKMRRWWKSFMKNQGFHHLKIAWNDGRLLKCSIQIHWIHRFTVQWWKRIGSLIIWNQLDM